MTLKENKEELTLGGVIADLVGIAMSFYFVLLYYFVWGWYLEERFFDVTYWQLYVGLMVLSFILGLGSFRVSVNKRFEKYHGKPSTEEKVTSLIEKTFSITVAFGILYLIHVLIVYYN